jgi:hypothetical protein
MYLALLLPRSMTGSPLSRMPQPSLKSAPAGCSTLSTRPRGTAVASRAGSDAWLPSLWRRRWLRGRRPSGGRQLACATVSPMPRCGLGLGVGRLWLGITDPRNCAFDWEIVGLSVSCCWDEQSNKKKVQPSSYSSIVCRRSLLHVEAKEPLGVSVRNSAGRS